MQRRTFCEAGVYLTLGSFIPFAGCSSGVDPALRNKLSLPVTLASLNDSETIIQLGNAYLKKVASENDPDKLAKLLLVDYKDQPISESTDSLTLQGLMKEKVKADFENDQIVVVNGWVLSRTEARQCALYSLIKPLQ